MKRSAADIAEGLVVKLWKAFLIRVPYALTYTELVTRRGGRIIHDHLGFRTFNDQTGEQPGGIQAIKHIFDCLGYHPAEKYTFPKKHLKAVCFDPLIPGLPKIFVSQLDVQQLPVWAQHLLRDAFADTPYLLSDSGIELLGKLREDAKLTSEAAEILENELVKYFFRPWNPPLKDTVLKLNDVSHYAAWVLLHGNAPSHFAVLTNMQDVEVWPDLETTCNALKKCGLPMKEKIEGEQGSSLRQTATCAVKENVEVRSDSEPEEITWTYAYLELIQRGYLEENDRRYLFQGFIESQERHLYNMTRTLDN